MTRSMHDANQDMYDALHGIQLWGIVGQTRDSSLGKGRAGSNDEFLAAYKRLEERVDAIVDENAKLRKQAERLQPKDREGNVLDIADTVSMLRSEHDGDHEWNDVVVELVLTKWGGDRWIVRGSRGEAWACDCSKTGRDEDAYEDSDDAEPIANPTLMECENAKLRALCRDMYLVVELLDMDGMALQTHGKSSDWRTLKERYDELTGVDG